MQMAETEAAADVAAPSSHDFLSPSDLRAMLEQQLSTVKTNLANAEREATQESTAGQEKVQRLIQESKARLQNLVAGKKVQLAQMMERATEQLGGHQPSRNSVTDAIERARADLDMALEDEMQELQLAGEASIAEMRAMLDELIRSRAPLKEVLEQLEADINDEGSNLGRKLTEYSAATEPSGKLQVFKELLSNFAGTLNEGLRALGMQTQPELSEVLETSKASEEE